MVQPHYHPCSGDCPDGLTAAAVAAREDGPSCICPLLDVTKVGEDGGEGIRTFVQGYNPACPACVAVAFDITKEKP